MTRDILLSLRDALVVVAALGVLTTLCGMLVAW